MHLHFIVQDRHDTRPVHCVQTMLPPHAKQLDLSHATPTEVAASWPASEPIIALVSNATQSRWSRWSVLAPATGKRLKLNGPDAMDQLREVLQKSTHNTLLPNWIGYLSYELGMAIEPTTGTLAEQAWPLVDLIWCDKALVHDGETNTWWSIGDLKPPKLVKKKPAILSCSALIDIDGDDAFKSAVNKTVDFIHAGDIFQANITRRFSADVCGDIRGSALNMLGDDGGFFGAWIEFPEDGRYILSLSPELFLQTDGESGEILTRPMKGTRPESEEAHVLLESEKDAAELHMIVDLMRNDLGRVCEFGSIEVRESRAIEKHPTVWQCVGEVRGVLRDSSSISDVLEATFPAGSITGAPKIRAMQIINALETSPRGPYCGAIGIVGNSSMLNVGIRTALFTGSSTPDDFKGTLHYSTGCGIVAESDADSELAESEVKTHILRNLINL
jgi:anthranilate/para-aminobenzoate synthase component I